MKLLKTGLSALAALLVLALPSAAFAGAVVPSDNPAAIQYTEAFPTSRGPTDADNSGRPQHPDRALGERNAKRLENEGEDGRETARVAAATAPLTGGRQAIGRGSESGSGSNSNGGGGGKGSDISQEGGGAGVGMSGADNGDSGLGKVAGQATGLDTGEGTGVLLPLAILAAVAWGSAYVLRRRKRAAQ